jgi:hypothetical protein
VLAIQEERIYEQVVEVTRDYLGPAADRFIARQVTNHLHKRPEELIGDDLIELIDWLKLSMAFLTDDESLIMRYVDELQGVVSTGGMSPRKKKGERRTDDGRKITNR